MAIFTKTASAASQVRESGSALRTQADLTQYINTFYNEIVDEIRGQINDMALMGMFREESQQNDEEITATKVRGTNVAPLNEDGEDLTFLQWGQGWSYTWYVYPYRLAVKHTRHLNEIENFGAIRQEGEELRDATARTVKFALADVWNRSLGASGAPFLCYDGMYLFDSARPNPVIGVPAHSNLETTGDLTEDLLFTAEQNVQATKAHNGDELDLNIEKIYLPRAYDRVMWRLRNTDGLVGTSMNDANWAKGRFNYETLRELTSNIIIYQLGNPKSEANGLQVRWAVKPNTAPINFEDPDIVGQRIRMRFGIGCLDPRAMWRGGALNSL